MYVVFFVIITLAAVMIFPLRIKALGFINITYDQIGCISLKLFGIKVYSTKLQIENNKLYIFTKKGKKRVIKIVKENEDEVSIIDYLDNSFIAVANVKTLNYYIKVGLAGDAYSTAIITAALQIIGSGFIGIVSRNYPHLKSIQDVQPDFENEKLQVSFETVVGLSLITIIYAVYYAFFKTLHKNDRLLRKRKQKKQRG